MRDGRRLQAVFASRKAAEGQIAEWQGERVELGDAIAGLGRAERMELGLWVLRCRDAGLRIGEVMAAGFAAVQATARPRMTVAAACAGCMAERERIGASKTWKGTLASIFKALCVWQVGARPMGELDLSELTAPVVVGWLEGNGWEARTKNGYLGGVRGLTAWAVREKILVECPLQAIPRWIETPGEVKRLSVEECRRLLVTVAREDAALLGFVGLGLFAGVRPAEIRRLHWSDWHAAAGEITIAAGKAKTRQRDVIEVPAPGATWVDMGRAAQGDEAAAGGALICPKNFVRRWDRARRKAGLYADWPEDGLRHTAATMHYAMHRNESAAQALLRHRSSAMLHRHYRGLATRAEAEAFWGLTPEAVRMEFIP
jgi:integrase